MMMPHSRECWINQWIKGCKRSRHVQPLYVLEHAITFGWTLYIKLFSCRSQNTVWGSWDLKEIHEVKNYALVKDTLKMEDRPMNFNVIVYEKFRDNAFRFHTATNF